MLAIPKLKNTIINKQIVRTMTFSAVKIKMVNGRETEMNLSSILGNILWGSATTISQDRLARDIHDNNDVVLSDADKNWIQNSITGKLNYATCSAIKKLFGE